MSANRPRRTRKAGAPVCATPRAPLRLVPAEQTRPRPEPHPELKAVLDDLRRRHDGEQARLDDGGDEPEAA